MKGAHFKTQGNYSLKYFPENKSTCLIAARQTAKLDNIISVAQPMQ